MTPNKYESSILIEIIKLSGVDIVFADVLSRSKNCFTLNNESRISGLSLNELCVDSFFGNKIKIEEICDLITKLTSLERLYLEKNGIFDTDFLSELHKLKYLSLRGNEIDNSRFCKNLNDLVALDLGKNNISKIKGFSSLPNLKKLCLDRNNISETYQLVELTSLVELTLEQNLIAQVSCLEELPNLVKLNLGQNQIKNIKALSFLSMLKSLNLSDNRISNINSLKELKELAVLDLSYNQVTDISPLRHLKKLEALRLHSNRINSLPIWVTELGLKIDYTFGLKIGSMSIAHNPVTSPPLEVIQQGGEAIRSYYNQLFNQGEDTIYEAKLMLVGEPGAGKTSLMRKLFDRKYPVPKDDQESTLGIDIRENWKFKNLQEENCRAHIWDFGGQQIQYMLHQFFLTPDCVYVLVADKRRELANFDYWLDVIRLLGKRSPVIVVMNEINHEAATNFGFDEFRYKKLFPELQLKKQDVNLANIGNGEFDVLVKTIKGKLSDLPHMGKKVPARWVDIRNALESKREEKHMSIQSYFDLCAHFSVTREADQLLILNYFHLLGIVLHFKDDEYLCGTLFLNPNWTVDAVYTLLADKSLEKTHGKLTRSKIDEVWAKKNYSFDDRAKLLQLMLKDAFELCYKVPGKESLFIVPCLLPKDQPSYQWEEQNNLQFRFQYSFMPKGILSRLIVRLNEKIHMDKVWQEGALFSNKAAVAEVIETTSEKSGGKIISIRLSKGIVNERIELLTEIRSEIKRIQTSSFPNLPFNELIPCSCKECALSKTPFFFTYEQLQSFTEKGHFEIQCLESTARVDISKLLGSVFNIEEIKSRVEEMTRKRDNNIHIEVNPTIENNQIVGQEQSNTQEQHQTIEQALTVAQQAKQVHGLFKNLKEDLLDEIEIEIDDLKEVKRTKKMLEKTEVALSELAENAGEKDIDEAVKGRLEEFTNSLIDEESKFNKTLELLSDGKDKVQKLGRVYNGFASNLGLPIIPTIILGES